MNFGSSLRVRTVLVGVLTLLIVALIAGCDNLLTDDDSSSDGSDLVDYDGVSQEIQDFVPRETLTVIENDLGATVNRGDTPPTFNSEYKMEPVTFQESNVPNEFYSRGQRIADLYIRFSEQDTENNSLRVDFVEKNFNTGAVISVSEGIGSYIIGRDNAFSVFSKVEQDYQGDLVEGLYVFSGVLEEDGIRDFEYTNLMLDNRGSTRVIPNDTGRLFYDGDEFAEAHEYPDGVSSAAVSGNELRAFSAAE